MRVALSGGIASGKTTVSNALATYDVPIIDTDVIAREVVVPGSKGLKQVVDRFGQTVLDASGQLNRLQLRELIFSNENARRDLESILHPLIRAETQAQLENLQTKGTLYCVVVIPLLVETGQQSEYDHVIIVDVEPSVQLKRIMKRDDCSREHAESIVASQATRAERLAVADELILNSSTEKAMDLQVKKLHKHLTLLARKRKYSNNNWRPANCDTPH